MSIRRAARHSFGHRHSDTIVIGGWIAKALVLAAVVGGAKWAYDHAPDLGRLAADWWPAGIAIGVGLLLAYVARSLFRPRIRG